MKSTLKSSMAYKEARRLMPGGVNSPVRSFRGIAENPLFIAQGNGSRITDIDGNEFIDYCLSWGVMILGHGQPDVITAATDALLKGSSFGAPTRYENKLASLIISMVPSFEKVRLVNSGTEAVMSAVRLARGYTGRPLIVKFDGCYHGHSDGLLVSAGSGLGGSVSSTSAGIPAGVLENTISLPFNDKEAVETLIRQRGSEIAAVLVEPIPANMGLVLPEPGYLEFLREITKKNDILLVFDEVISGFRVSRGGAQEHFGIRPDLTVLGKIVGGGFPLAAFGGFSAIMDYLAPDGPVYQAGTLSGNPVAVTAGVATLQLLNQPGFYEENNRKAESFFMGFNRLQQKFPVHISHINGMFSLFFSENPPRNFREVKESNESFFPGYYKYMLSRNIYFSPGYYETNFISMAHTPHELYKTLDIMEHALNGIFSKAKKVTS
jgi:glutamate-1-semialdehyde 2,1-aminomutase